MILRQAGSHVLRLCLALGFFAAWGYAYSEINAMASVSERAVQYTTPAERHPWVLQPWMAVIYVFGVYVLVAFSFFSAWNWRGLWRALGAYGASTLISFPIYILYPLKIARADYVGEGLGDRLMRMVVALDDPANCFPSSHTYLAVTAALLIGVVGRPPWVSVVAWALAAVICVTTVTVGQHYYMDVPGGIATALVGYHAARWLLPRVFAHEEPSPRAQEPPCPASPST